MDMMVGGQASDVAFEHFYRSEWGTVYRFLYRRCPDHEVAEDIAAETFLAAARAWNGEQELTPGWLMTVARRRLVDHWRRAARQDRLLRRLQAEPERAAEHGWTAPDDELREALAALPERQRRAMELRYVDQHSVTEVAEHMGVPYSAAESLLARGRRACR